MLFDNEYQDSGIYNPELTEPDYSNAQNSALWEIHTLRVSCLFFVGNGNLLLILSKIFDFIILKRHCNNSVKENASIFLKETTNFSLNDAKM